MDIHFLRDWMAFLRFVLFVLHGSIELSVEDVMTLYAQLEEVIRYNVAKTRLSSPKPDYFELFRLQLAAFEVTVATFLMDQGGT